MSIPKTGRRGFLRLLGLGSLVLLTRHTIPVEDGENVRRAKVRACKTYMDIRYFGVVMTKKEANCGQVRVLGRYS